jgi:hypothetical protein
MLSRVGMAPGSTGTEMAAASGVVVTTVGAAAGAIVDAGALPAVLATSNFLRLKTKP